MTDQERYDHGFRMAMEGLVFIAIGLALLLWACQ